MDEQAMLDSLIAEWQCDQEEGRSRSLVDLCRERPELLPELEKRLALLKQLEKLTRSETASHTGADSVPTDPRSPTRPLPSLPGYEILSRVGEGGMGVVYLARDNGLRRQVAIKMLLHAEHDSEAKRTRFRAEAEALARLRHPHIVGIHAWGEHQGIPFFSLEYLEKGSLDGQIADRPQPPREAARLVLLVARAIHAAHRAGILHRDLKPANILLAPPADEPALNCAYGWPKVADFGLVRSLGETPAASQTAVAGTPSYMAPEQVEGRARDIGPPTDVYALGAILYELLTGRPPFKGSNLFDTLDQVRSRPPRPVREIRPDVPPDLAAICHRCLAKVPDERYPSAQALADDLARFLDGETPLAPAPPLSHRRLLAPLAVAFLLLIGALVIWRSWPERATTEPTLPRSVTLPTPLTVPSLRITHFRPVGEVAEDHGDLGNQSLSTRYGDQVRVLVEMSEEVSLYLLAFNADGSEQLCWPEDETTPPPLSRTLKYPGGGKAFTLNDEPRGGLQAFAVVASRRPLPPYAEWKSSRGPLPWKRIPLTSGVWRDDGDGLETLRENQRGKVEGLKGLEPLTEVIAGLRSAQGIDVVSVRAFPVTPK